MLAAADAMESRSDFTSAWAVLSVGKECVPGDRAYLVVDDERARGKRRRKK